MNSAAEDIEAIGPSADGQTLFCYDPNAEVAVRGQSIDREPANVVTEKELDKLRFGAPSAGAFASVPSAIATSANAPSADAPAEPTAPIRGLSGR